MPPSRLRRIGRAPQVGARAADNSAMPLSHRWPRPCAGVELARRARLLDAGAGAGHLARGRGAAQPRAAAAGRPGRVRARPRPRHPPGAAVGLDPAATGPRSWPSPSPPASTRRPAAPPDRGRLPGQRVAGAARRAERQPRRRDASRERAPPLALARQHATGRRPTPSTRDGGVSGAAQADHGLGELFLADARPGPRRRGSVAAPPRAPTAGSSRRSGSPPRGCRRAAADRAPPGPRAARGRAGRRS